MSRTHPDPQTPLRAGRSWHDHHVIDRQGAVAVLQTNLLWTSFLEGELSRFACYNGSAKKLNLENYNDNACYAIIWCTHTADLRMDSLEAENYHRIRFCCIQVRNGS